MAIFHRGSIKHTAVIPVAGDHVTGDIAFGLRTSIEEAERIKQRYGCAVAAMASNEAFEVSPVGEGQRPRSISRQLLAEIIEPRVEEILRMVEEELERSNYSKLIPAGVVLTGGTSLMEGIVDMATDIFGLPVRRGYPRNIGGLVDIVNNPQYATAVGLVLYGAHRGRGRAFRWREEESRIKRKIKDLLREVFLA